MRRSRIRDAASLAGFLVVLLGFAGAANAWDPVHLTDAQLDGLTAAASATASGTGIALGGAFADSSVSVASGVGVTSRYDGFALGQVTAVASSSAQGPNATASSSLSLSVTSP